MSIVSVQPKDFILALFIRDDGERFLLGDGGYGFKDSQLHFVGNTIENDEVAKQGTDGTLLAGQVRRSAIQSFDGYIGDATVTKEAIEQMRRDFIAFFMKGHHFRVVYVDCARNAWQRKGGYLVDAPEVKELWQIHPEYHVALNFEDVNYYVYDENADGDEILAIVQSVPISSEVEGGLEWDANGAISDAAQMDNETKTVTGSNIHVTDAVVAPFADVQLEGNTSQNGTPTPSAPVAVRTVTGENVVKISDGQGNEQSYTVDLASKNLFDESTAADGYRLDASGAPYADYTFTLSDYIPVKPNTTYTVSYGSAIPSYAHVASYGSDKTFVYRWYIGAVSSFTFITQANAYYIRLAIPIGNKDTTQCELGSQATSYAPYFTPIELCKIGTYQDYIYASGGKWYVHKAVGKFIFPNTGWVFRTDSQVTDGSVFRYSNYVAGEFVTGAQGISSHFIVRAASSGNVLDTVRFIDMNTYGYNVCIANAAVGITSSDSNSEKQNKFNAWCGSNNPAVYYVKATPTDTIITNEALVAQLNNLKEGGTLAGINNIAIVPAVGNETGTLEIQYYTKYSPVPIGGGYVWEEGGEGGPTTVINESIAEVYPVWTVPGPALNPTLENVTTGEQIEFVGMVGEGQTLIVDMGAQTALLNGLNVISSMAGEFISLQVGQNTLLYSASGDAGASEIGWSPIVG